MLAAPLSTVAEVVKGEFLLQVRYDGCLAICSYYSTPTWASSRANTPLDMPIHTCKMHVYLTLNIIDMIIKNIVRYHFTRKP